MFQASIYPLVILVVLALVAALLFRWAWRWKREPIPATCRRCGYDVSKRPEGVEKCSECGSDLTAPRGITHTRRRSNWWLATPAGLALVILLGLIGLFAAVFPWVAWSGANAPISWVAWMARHNSGALGDQYRAAWMSRGGDRSSAFYDALLDLYAGPNAPWAGQWDDVLSNALRNGWLSQAQRDRLATEAFKPPTFRVRSPVRQNDPLVVEMNASLQRNSIALAGTTNYANMDGQVWFAARADEPATLGQRFSSFGRINGHESFQIPAKEWAPDVKPGRHKLHLILARQLAIGSYLGKPMSKRIEQRGEVEVEVLPAKTSIGTPIVDPSQASAIASQVGVHIYHWNDGRIVADVDLFPVPVDRAFAIYVVVDGVEKRISYIAAKSGDRGSVGYCHIPVRPSKAKTTDRLTIVLVGDGDALRNTLDQTRYWRGRIEFPDVSLQPWKDWATDMNAVHKPTTWPYVLPP